MLLKKQKKKTSRNKLGQVKGRTQMMIYQKLLIIMKYNQMRKMKKIANLSFIRMFLNKIKIKLKKLFKKLLIKAKKSTLIALFLIIIIMVNMRVELKEFRMQLLICRNKMNLQVKKMKRILKIYAILKWLRKTKMITCNLGRLMCL